MSKTIYILAPYAYRTGGPEALAQLSDALSAQGWEGRVFVVYFDDNQGQQLSRIPHNQRGTVPELKFGVRTNTIAEYAGYKVAAAGAIPNNPDSIIVLPESRAPWAAFFPHASVVIWWLSVDNALGWLPDINLNHLRRSNVFHAAQSEYARRFLPGLQFPCAGMLSDYTTDLSPLAGPQIPLGDRPLQAAFNVNFKVVANLPVIGAEIAKVDPAIKLLPIANMAREDVAKTLSQTRLYVDLGSFPGKDRTPREAASLGCAALLAGRGAGALAEDFDAGPTVDPFDAEAVAARVVTLVRDPNLCARLAATLAAQVKGEKERFFAEARTLFSALDG